jgi:hypothetical protein
MTMANAQFTIDAADRADASIFNVPQDEPGTEDSVVVDDISSHHVQHWYVHVENGFDVNVDVIVKGSHYLDETLSSAVDDEVAKTVNSGTNTFLEGEGHSYIGANIDPATTPSTGTLTVTFQTREA